MQSIRRELGRIYRLARKGELDLEHLRGFTYALRTMAEIIERAELEVRVEAVERRAVTQDLQAAA